MLCLSVLCIAVLQDGTSLRAHGLTGSFLDIDFSSRMLLFIHFDLIEHNLATVLHLLSCIFYFPDLRYLQYDTHLELGYMCAGKWLTNCFQELLHICILQSCISTFRFSQCLQWKTLETVEEHEFHIPLLHCIVIGTLLIGPVLLIFLWISNNHTLLFSTIVLWPAANYILWR